LVSPPTKADDARKNALSAAALAGPEQLLVAVEELERLEGTKATVAYLSELLLNEKKPGNERRPYKQTVEIRAVTAHVLGRSSENARAALPELAKALNDRRVARRFCALGEGIVPEMLGTIEPHSVSLLGLERSWALRNLGAKATPAVPGLIAALKSDDVNVRWDAARALGDLGDVAQDAIDDLVAIVRDDDAGEGRSGYFTQRDVRAKAAFSLGQIGGQPEVVVPLLRQALHHDDLEIRQWAALGLGRMKADSAAAIPDLIEALADEGNNLPRAICIYSMRPEHWAATALVNIGPAAIPALTAALSHGNPRVRRHAANAFWYFGRRAERAAPALAELLVDDDVEIRRKAAAALGELRPRSDEAIESLIHALGDEDAEVRQLAAAALEEIGPSARSAADRLAESLDDEESDVRKAAIRALKRTGAATAVVPAITKVLDDKNEEVRIEALLALSSFGREASTAIPQVILRVHDRHDWVKTAAIEALAKIASADVAVPAIIELVRFPNHEVRRRVAEDLAAIGPAAAKAVPQLARQLTRDDDDEVRMAMADALGAIDRGSDAAIGALTQALSDDHAYVRTHAAMALGQIGPKARQAVLGLLALLDDGEARTAAALAVVEIDQRLDAAMPVLLDALDDPGPWAASQAAYNIGRIGPAAKAAVPKLLAMLEDDETGMAAEALGKLGEAAAPALPKLRRALELEDGKLRVHAAISVWKLCGDKRMIGILATFAVDNSTDWDTRFQAVKALGEIGPPAKEAAQTLREHIDDGGRSFEDTVIEALRRIDPDAATPGDDN
jgi:HEAT repeat protein